MTPPPATMSGRFSAPVLPGADQRPARQLDRFHRRVALHQRLALINDVVKPGYAALA